MGHNRIQRMTSASGGASIDVVDANCVFDADTARERAALRDVNLRVQPGEFVCVVGPSGHGKSTLLRAISGLTPLTSGQIRIGEQRIDGPTSACSMVFQDDTVLPWLRVRDNVEYGLRARKVEKAERHRVATRWLDAVGLQEVAGAWPKALSGGMRKRVALAMVFATGVGTLLMDEPFGSLDYVTRMLLHDIVLNLWTETGRTVVFVTHDIEEALVLASRIIVVGGGTIVEDFAVDLPRPRDERVRASEAAVEMTRSMLDNLRREFAAERRHEVA